MSRVLILRAGVFSRRTTIRAMTVCVLLGTVLAVCLSAALMLGTRTLSPGEVFAALGPGADSSDRLVVVEWRAPRAVAALLFGACLGLSGSIFQSLTRNPLGSPDVVGLNAGAYTGVVAAMLLGADSFGARATGAMLGGLGAAAIVYLLAFREGVRGIRLVIVGIAVSAMLSSVNTWFGVKADLDDALQVAVWGAGTLSGVEWPPVLLSAGVALALIAAVPAATRRMRQLELGEEAAAMLGVGVERSKVLLLVLASLLTAIATAVTGPVAFIALAAPQIAGRLTGHGSSADPLGAALTGAVLMSAADLVAQHAIPDAKLPVGAVTVCLGGSYLVWLLLREARNW
ncbi:FecCD family ABC transporter permease [Nocardia sp. NPDC003345]